MATRDVSRFRPWVGSSARVAVLAVVGLGLSLQASDTPAPSSVTIAGSLQGELGCPGDWQPDCADTRLAFDAADGVWQGVFAVPAGSWEYKAALNGSWDENYGARAQRNGPNVALSLPSARSVKFYYDHATHWIADNVGQVIATVPGSFQGELGCPGDWQPDCLRSWLQDPDGDGTYAFATRDLPPGSYEAKVAIDERWDVNYGAGGVQNGANIPFTVATAGELVTFSYDAVSHVLSITTGGAAPQPSSVTIAGSLQGELGCPGDWQPDCADTRLAFDAADEVWQGVFAVPAGTWEYKAALNGSWDENYGAGAQRNGPNIPLSLPSARSVKFYYDHQTHWITDNVGHVIATAPGSFQSELGCPGDWQPDCLRSWLQDPDGDGIYTFSTRRLPPGDYETKVAIDERWDENYGAGGVPNGPNIPFTVTTAGAEVFFSWNALTKVLTVSTEGAPAGDLSRARAHWVSADLLLWDVPGIGPDGTVALHHAADASLGLDAATGIVGGSSFALAFDPAGAPADVREKFPHLAGAKAFRVPAARRPEVPTMLRGQVALSATNAAGRPVDATAVQVPGVLDDLFAYDGPLGAAFDGPAATLRLWAPTAQEVRLRLYESSDPSSPPAAVVPMIRDEASGVWSAGVDGAWRGKFYAFEVRVFTRATRRVETNVVTDPYSVSLSMNSRRSQLVDLSDPALMPDGWLATGKPPLDAPEDITLYELHVRDFSASDDTVRPAWRGTYLAFTEPGSHGMRHLASLAEAGLTHVHLLPSFDFATVDEDKSRWEDPGDLSGLPPDGEQQQARVTAVRGRDGFNWGYDPWHYNVPEGSYATDPEGAVRVREYRAMVQALNRAGLRVVADVVYNHTTAAGQNETSVLDRIVPGYYHRLNADGAVETSTCCQNTASEHAMMEKLLVDSVVLWAKHYRLDGFRFDLMGHHMKRNLLRVRAALDALTPARDGIDGRRVFVYGEGWNFGEVADNARGVNAVQLNMAGTGIGSFNDRVRDAARGGGPFSGVQEQGFLTGLWTDPNATGQGSADEQRDRLLAYQDRIKVSLAGNLREVSITDRFGALVRGDALDYNGLPAGYTADPQESINYVEAHDNDTLWDAIQLKAAPATGVADRVRMQMLGMSLVGLGQGVPFFHAGVELLRSKSLDRNSYDSGDWFNRLDFSSATNNWGVGLPPAADNQANWPLFGPLLADPALAVGEADIRRATSHFREVLSVRRSSSLFRLRTAAAVTAHQRFLNAGPAQVPGVIAYELSDAAGSFDRRWSRLLVVFNAAPSPVSVADPALVGRRLVLHPLQRASADEVVRGASFDSGAGSASVPGRTTAVFVEHRPASQRLELLLADVVRLVEEGTLRPGNGNALSATLRAALSAVERGNPHAARGALGAFVNQVEALERGGRLGEASAAALVAEVQDILATLGG